MISFSFFAITLRSSSLLNTCNAANVHLQRREWKKVVIIDFNAFCAVLFVHLLQSHLHDNYRRYFNWAAVSADEIFLWLFPPALQALQYFMCFFQRLGSGSIVSMVRYVPKIRNINVFFLMFRPQNKSSAFASGENEEEKWSKRRMEIYEPYLLLFRECFHIRYPHIKSSPPSLRFLIPTLREGRGMIKKEMPKLTETRLSGIMKKVA